jgi:hypothetical protein
VNSSASGANVGSFTFMALPASILGNGAPTVTINFDPLSSGNYAAFVLVGSNGGSAFFDVVGQGGGCPVAKVEFQTPDGSGWVQYNNATYFTFGNVTPICWNGVWWRMLLWQQPYRRRQRSLSGLCYAM